MSYTIKEASGQDVPELCRLVNNAYRGESSKKGWTTEADLLDGNRIDEKSLRENIDEPSATILKVTNEENEIVAAVYLKKEPGNLYLGMLTVSPLLQAKGLGAKLLQASEDRAKLWAVPAIKMTVIADRTELIAWYERHGYYKTGEMLPFHADEKFGKPRKHLDLLVLAKMV